MKYPYLLLGLMYVIPVFSQTGQTNDRQSFRNYFYDQRRSFFESMPVTHNETIMLGNSITNGASWDEIFPDVNIKNRGISGDVTLGVLDRIEEITRRQPRKIFILIGINDIARDIRVDTIVANYASILDQIKNKSPHSQVYIQSLMPTNDAYSDFKNHQGKTDKILELNERLGQLAKDHKLTFIDLYPSFSNRYGKLNEEYTNDGLHLTGKGYVFWSQILKPYIYE